METTVKMILVYILLPLAGIGLILFSLLRAKRLCQRPVDLEYKKLGLHLKCDTLSLLVLLGFVMAIAGAFFYYGDYEDDISKLELQLENANTEIAAKDQVLQKFQCYAMRFSLVFPPEDSVDADKISVQAIISRQGQGQPQITAPDTRVGLSNDLWVHIDDLHPGDELRILAYEEEGRGWRSTNVCEIPKTQLKMARSD
ncbi:MAG: hypothetical protein JSV44_05880 [Candidatus Zixiibacteriota bacterium]|nr:MAG: hypothetical protein JSV44_05880 [candidate division Zixibacteria bacterium]